MTINGKAFHKLHYGLYLFSARQDDRDNACIVDAVAQVAADPKMIMVSSCTGGRTQQMVDATGAFNLSVLPEGVSMDFYQHFGMQSGHKVEKCSELDLPRLENGIVYAPEANAVISCVVKHRIDLGDHILYIAESTYADVLNDTPSVTYAGYRAAKAAGLPTAGEPQGAATPAADSTPKAEPATDASAETEAKPASVDAEPAGATTKWVCLICGHVHEGPEPPESCPMCGVGPELFERC